MKVKITIETKTGNIIDRNATITDFIDNKDNQFSIATVGNAQYEIIREESDRHIWGIK